jgi:hypothetical protein
MFNICVSYKTIPAISFATSRAGDWIDKNVAQVLGIKTTRATAIKESHHHNFDQREYFYGNKQQASKPILKGYEAWQELRNLLTELRTSADEPK